MSDVSSEPEKESIGSFIGNIILCLLFPFVVLWYGPKYLFKGEYIKGIVIIVLVVAELILVNSVYNVF